MFLHARRVASYAAVGAVLVGFSNPHSANAQSRTFEACTSGTLTNCANIRLSTQSGVGPGSTNRFDIGIQNLGSQSTPSVATSVYFLALLTGQPAAADVDVAATPTAEGGASVSDASDWSLFESGDAIFLSAPGNNGIGGCAFSAPVGGYGLMGQTCGSGAYMTFSFFTPRSFDLSAITLAGMEFVAVADGNAADSCNDDMPCAITDVVVTPEPASVLLLLAGLSGIAGIGVRRRSTADARHLNAGEV